MSFANLEILRLSEAQQYFLQLMLQKSVIDQVNFKGVFCMVLDRFYINYSEDRLRETYVKFLREINDVIRHFNIEIKTGVCEITGLSYFCLIRQTDTSNITKFSKLYSSVELRVFRKVLELVIESETGSVDINFILTEVSEYFENLAQEVITQNEGITKAIFHFFSLNMI